jgi:hypothetical protein
LPGSFPKVVDTLASPILNSLVFHLRPSALGLRFAVAGPSSDRESCNRSSLAHSTTLRSAVNQTVNRLASQPASRPTSPPAVKAPLLSPCSGGLSRASGQGRKGNRGQGCEKESHFQ